MSGATYRIDLHHEPNERYGLQWCATIVRLSDDFPCEVVMRATAVDANDAARAWIQTQHAQQTGFSLYVDDEGQDADAPHSVKA